METRTEWNIEESSKVLMLVTDNGANVVKAMRQMGEEAGDDAEDEQHEEVEDNNTQRTTSLKMTTVKMITEYLNSHSSPTGTCCVWHIHHSS